MKYLSKIVKCYKNAFSDMLKHDGFEHGGYIAFLCMLSIFPFFIFFTAAITKIGDKLVYNITGESLLSIFTFTLSNSHFSQFIGALRPRLIEITSTPPQSFLSLAIISVIWTASSLLEGLRTILNRAYRVVNPPSYLLRRMMSIIQFILITFIVMVISFTIKFFPILSNGVIILLKDYQEYELIKRILEIINLIYTSVSSIIEICIIFLFLSYIYYLIPNKQQKFSHTFIGTLHTIILWWLCTHAFQYYLSIFHQINIVYGSITGIIIALLYFYMCSIIFIYGGELNYWVCRIILSKEK